MPRRAAEAKYKLTRDVLIPAGTAVTALPSHTVSKAPSASILVGPTKDTTFEWSMHMEDALAIGLVEQV